MNKVFFPLEGQIIPKTGPDATEIDLLWAKVPLDVQLKCSYRRYDPDEPFYGSEADADAARPEDRGSLVTSVLLVSFPESKIVLQCGTLSDGEQKAQEVLALAVAAGLNAQMVWELSFLPE